MLACMPEDAQRCCADLLDVRSAGRFAQTCRAGHGLVSSRLTAEKKRAIATRKRMREGGAQVPAACLVPSYSARRAIINEMAHRLEGLARAHKRMQLPVVLEVLKYVQAREAAPINWSEKKVCRRSGTCSTSNGSTFAGQVGAWPPCQATCAT